MPTPNEIRESITTQIIEAIESGRYLPWRRPWCSSPNAGAPANVVSRRGYSLMNSMLLQIAAHRFGFESRWFGTYRQWSELGCQVRRRPADVPPGKWGTQVLFCRPFTKTKLKDGQEVEESFWTLKTYTVFNAQQVDGELAERLQVVDEPLSSAEIDRRFEEAERVVQATGIEVRFGGDRAFYVPSDDYIQMPHRTRFLSPAAFYETVYHEAIHATEHPLRLGWDRAKEGYAAGELIAELGACFLAGELRLPIDASLGNHASYLGHWLEQMRADPQYLFKAASQATKATEYILSFSRPEEQGVAAEAIEAC